MFGLLKILFVLVLLGGIGLVGFAYLGDLSPQQQEITQPIELNAN